MQTVKALPCPILIPYHSTAKESFKTVIIVKKTRQWFHYLVKECYQFSFTVAKMELSRHLDTYLWLCMLIFWCQLALFALHYITFGDFKELFTWKEAFRTNYHTDKTDNDKIYQHFEIRCTSIRKRWFSISAQVFMLMFMLAGMEHINQRTHLINSVDKIMSCAPYQCRMFHAFR